MDCIRTFDILEYVHHKLGYRLSLNHLAQCTLRAEKSGDGLQALEWFKQGKLEKLAEYCSKDTEITRDLLLHGIESGCLVFENKEGKMLRLVTRWNLDRLKEGIWD